MKSKVIIYQKSISLVLTMLSITVFAGGSPIVLAQESSVTLEEIIVTARKREESLQDVPVAVTYIGKELEEANVRRLQDIQSYSPNVYIRKAVGVPGGAEISIRGVSYAGTDKTYDPSIAVVMDGMYIGTGSSSLLNNFDIERIEILRGPQGTLHGKNTTGGVIQIIRTPVTMDWGGKLDVTLGSDGRRDFSGVLNAPIVKDTLGIKLFANSVNSDGHIRNLTFNKDVGGDDLSTYGITAKWEPNENSYLQFHFERNTDDSDISAPANLNQPGGSSLVCSGKDFSGESLFGPTACQAMDPNSGKNTSSADKRSKSDSEIDNYILTASWDAGSFLLTSITARRDLDESFIRDFDGTSAQFLTIDYDNKWDQFSQELRVTSQLFDDLEFMVGLFYWDVDYQQSWDTSELHYTLSRLGPNPRAEDTLSYARQNQSTKSTATFFSADYQLGDWTLTVGGRWTQEKKVFFGGDSKRYRRGQVEPTLNFTGFSKEWTNFTPKAGLSYQLNDDTMVFGSYSEGFKSGGFLGRQVGFDINPAYEPEFVKSIEFGMKSTWMDGRLIFNPTVFKNDYQDKQETIALAVGLDNVRTVVRNAASLDILGAELELQYQITSNWDVRTNYGYLHTKYDGFNADLNSDKKVTNNDHLVPRNTPENTFGISSTYSIAIGAGKLQVFGSYHWRDKIEVLVDNDALGHMDGISNLDATLTYMWGGGKYRISAYGRNITNERELRGYKIVGLVRTGQWNEGSNYGVKFSAGF